MKSSIEEITPIIGTAMDGGFYAGRIRRDDGQVYALIVAPKDGGEIADAEWIHDWTDVPGALSYNDGLTNTMAMADAGSRLAQWARWLRIANHDDWYIPSQDELEVIYRNLKPGTAENYCWARSGINLSAVIPTRHYTPDFPTQTQSDLFKTGAAEAFDEHLYWTSTRHIADKDYAWAQDFDDGHQVYSGTNGEFRARAVRRVPCPCRPQISHLVIWRPPAVEMVCECDEDAQHGWKKLPNT